jgi:hypothetical protein
VPAEVTVAVRVSDAPVEIDAADRVSTVEVTPCATVVVTTALVDVEKFVSPLYTAVRLFAPTVSVCDSVATPPVSVTVASTFVPSINFTVPVGTVAEGVAPEGPTVAVRVPVAPYASVAGPVSSVVVGAIVAVTFSAAAVAAA